MNVETFAQLSGETAQPGIYTRDVYRYVKTMRWRCKKRSHQRELIVLAPKVELLARAPRLPDRAHPFNHLTQAWNRCGPRHTETALIVSFHLRAESEYEASFREGSEVPGSIGQCHRAAGETESDGSSHF